MAHAEHAVRLLPECAPCFNIEGNILRQNHEMKRALTAYQKSVALSPSRAVRLNIIAMLDALGEHQRANTMRQAMQAELKAPAP